MSRLTTAVLVFSVVAFVAGAAQAATIPLGWSERHARYARHLVLTYGVDEVTIGRGWWRARLWIRNETNLRIRVQREFALLADAPGGRRRVLPAARSAPSLPAVIPILGIWRGVVSGPGVPSRASLLRLRFGTTSAVILPNHRITHVTRQSFRR